MLVTILNAMILSLVKYIDILAFKALYMASKSVCPVYYEPSKTYFQPE